ncbi:MAG: hypothetical protein QW520_00075 [Methanomassiliicoccales archaeon]
MKLKFLAIILAAIVVLSGVGVYAAFSMPKDNKSKEKDITTIALEVYGNADGDSNVDMDDVSVLERYLSLKSRGPTPQEMQDFYNETNFNEELADANGDGTIDDLDVQQTRAVVERKATHLWLKDGIGAKRKVDLNISRIGAEYYSNVELCLILGLADKIVAVDNAPYMYRDFYFTERQKANITNLVNMNTPDYPFVNELNLDILLVFYTNGYETKQTKIIDCDVIYLGLYNPDMSNARGSNFIQGILKAGYIFGKVERAEAYANWVLETRDRLAAIAASIPEEEKPMVLMSTFQNSYFMDPNIKTATVYCFTDPLGQACLLGGGRNIGYELYGSTYNTSLSQRSQVDALFNDDNRTQIEYIFLHMVKYTYGGQVVAGVPEHGYLARSHAEIASAWNNATSPAHTLMVDIDPNKVFLIAGDFRNGPTGAVLLGAYIGNIINHEYYKSIDPIALHNHYIRDWLGIKGYDVSRDGVFMYHPYR